MGSFDHNIQFYVGNTLFYTQKLSCGHIRFIIPNHSHGENCYEIHYIPSGYGHVHINGIPYDVTPDTLYVTGPHIEHAQAPLEEDPMYEYCVYIRIEKQQAQLPGSRLPREAALLSVFKNTPFWIGTDSQGMKPVMTELFLEIREGKVGYQTQIEALLKQIVVKLVRNMATDTAKGVPVPVSSGKDSTFSIIEEYFMFEYQNPSLDELAQRLGFSPRQTERLLVKHYGKTFLQKKTEGRMSAAATLLSDSRLSIAKIAEKVGYSSGEHFSTAFKKYYHVSPGHYRKGSR